VSVLRDKEQAKIMLATAKSLNTPIQGNKIAKRQLDRREKPEDDCSNARIPKANQANYFAEQYLTSMTKKM
jgi:hypothetical protein